MKRELQIGIIGAGTIGRVLALFLTKKGYNVELTAKDDNELVIDNRLNMEICGEFGEQSVLVPYVTNNKFSTKKDIIFVMVKSFKVSSALRQVVKYLRPNGIVVGIQNVLNLEEFFEVVPSNRFVSWVADWSAFRYVDRRLVIVNKSGDNHIGVLNPEAKVFLPIVQSLLNNIAETHIEEDMLDFILSKFILTSLTSCLGALTGYNLGHILKEKQGKRLYLNLVKEQLTVFESMLNHPVSPYYDALDYYKFTEEGVSGAIYRSNMFRRLINQNHNTVSSVLRNLEYNKPTELDCLIKKVVKIANSRGIKVPYCTQLSIILDEIASYQRGIILDNLYDDRLICPEKYMAEKKGKTKK